MLLSAPVTTSTHPNGLAHVSSTVRTMARLATEEQSTYPVRNLATRITHGVPSKQYALELASIYRWVRDNIRYRKDPRGVEWVQRPTRTVLEQAGDCDDIATLIAALVGSLGHEWRFHTVGESADVQSHVAVDVLVDGRWVTLDPVLEPPSTSTAPRAELGRFAQHAPGVARIWNSEGRMLGTHHRRVARRRVRLSGLGAPVSARDRWLWQWNAYFPPVGQALLASNQPAQGGVPAPFAVTYRSADAPGSPPPYYHDVMGAAGRGGMATLAGLGAYAYDASKDPIAGKKFGALQLATKLIPAAQVYFARMGHPLKSKNGKLVASPPLPPGALQDYLNRHHDKGSAAGVVKVLKSVAVPIVRAVVPGASAAIDIAQTAQKIVKTVKKAAAPVVRVLPKAATPALVRVLPKAATPALVRVLPKAATPAKVVRAVQKLAAKYPKGAKQVYDAAHRVYRVYVAKQKGVAGVGAFRPTISFALGAAAGGDAMAQLAQGAVNAVNAYKQANGKPPTGKLPAVLAFQRADAQLTDDGQWGPNAQAAASYYLGVPASKLPGFAAAFAKYPVTWRAPASSPSSSAPAATLAPVYRGTVADAAQAAVNAVNAYKQANGKPPAGKLAAVRAFQDREAVDRDSRTALTRDGLWGPNAQKAAAYYLAVPTSKLPGFAAAFAKTPVTWQPPGATVGPAVIKPAAAVQPAPKVVSKPAAPKVAAKPAAAPKPVQVVQRTVTKPSGAKEVLITAPGGGPIRITPSVPPLPLPGYVEVGRESGNPGLPPVPPAPAVSAQKPATPKPKPKVVAKKPAKKPAPKVAAKPAPHVPSGVTLLPPPAPSTDWLDTMPELGPPPIPSGQSAEQWTREQPFGGGARSNNELLWLAVGWLYLRSRRARAA